MLPGLIKIMWLPRWRANGQPPLRKALSTSWPLTGNRRHGSSNGNFHFAGFEGEWHTLFRTNLQATKDGFPNVCLGFLTGATLADATWNRRTFRDPRPILVPIQRDDKLHGSDLTRNTAADSFVYR